MTVFRVPVCFPDGMGLTPLSETSVFLFPDFLFRNAYSLGQSRFLRHLSDCVGFPVRDISERDVQSDRFEYRCYVPYADSRFSVFYFVQRVD